MMIDTYLCIYASVWRFFSNCVRTFVYMRVLYVYLCVCVVHVVVYVYSRQIDMALNIHSQLHIYIYLNTNSFSNLIYLSNTVRYNNIK